jgi:hypothetical protein
MPPESNGKSYGVWPPEESRSRGERLERLVWDAIYALQKAKLDSEVVRLRRAMERR